MWPGSSDELAKYCNKIIQPKNVSRTCVVASVCACKHLLCGLLSQGESWLWSFYKIFITAYYQWFLWVIMSSTENKCWLLNFVILQHVIIHLVIRRQRSMSFAWNSSELLMFRWSGGKQVNMENCRPWTWYHSSHLNIFGVSVCFVWTSYDNSHYCCQN